MQDSEHKDLSDPTYNAADFRLQLTGGRLRWFATVLAIASLGLLVDFLCAPAKAEFFFPFHAKGPAAIWTVAAGVLIWAVIAVVNWRSWQAKRKRRG